MLQKIVVPGMCETLRPALPIRKIVLGPKCGGFMEKPRRPGRESLPTSKRIAVPEWVASFITIRCIIRKHPELSRLCRPSGGIC